MMELNELSKTYSPKSLKIGILLFQVGYMRPTKTLKNRIQQPGQVGLAFEH